ncbi:putative C4-dicarboxylate transporter [Lyophyllum shimeji]|uniref:C4-dicarboxylate transporter n=1 Tax=Lyophyllum shimeji TaxID=47721 RepID=A0A9P3PJX2_LYOSH|nr:putative C4-dicarboxylate transporter [Lyophyllum shimeji]
MAGRRRKSVKECIRNFTPAWFTVIMGTGVLSALASRFPFGAGSLALEVISLLFFFLNLALFVLFCGITVARYWLFPEMWRRMLSHPAQSLKPAMVVRWKGLPLYFVGLLVDGYGNFLPMCFWHAAYYDDNAPSLLVQDGVRLGGLLANALLKISIHHALITTGVSLTALVMGLSLALMILTVYLTRLVLHGPPDVSLILSAFITLGPLGQGGFSFLINGENLSLLLPLHLGNTFPAAALTGELLYSACFCAAWVLWSMGIAWTAISLISVYAVARKEIIPFALAYWGLIFPTGVFGLLSVQLGVVLDSPFFKYFGAIWSVIVLVLWIFVSLKTVPAVWNASIFVAPCLASSSLISSEKAVETAPSEGS